jgi:hypothetical protein
MPGWHHDGVDGFHWRDFAAASPGLAALGLDRIQRLGFVLIGTVRADGTPRITAVEAHVVDGELSLAMSRGSRKADDLLRDPRILVHTPVTSASDPADAFQLRGRAVLVEDPERRRRVADAIEARSGWRPEEDFHIFAVQVARVAHLSGVYGQTRLTRWHRGATGEGPAGEGRPEGPAAR